MIYRVKDPKDGHVIVIDPDIDVYGASKLRRRSEVISVREAYWRGLIPLRGRGSGGGEG